MNDDFSRHCVMAAETLAKIKIVPVLVLNDETKALRLCELLMRYDLGAAEVTFRTPQAHNILCSISKHFPELYLGAGTILNVADLKRAFDAGAKFAVSPGFTPRVVKAAIESGYPFAPGVCTPSEIEQACELGCRFLKFFPAEAAGGAKMLSAMSAPYKHLGLNFMPTGGVTSKNAADYLALSNVAAIGGTWLGKAEDLEADAWDKIENLIKEAAELARSL